MIRPIPVSLLSTIAVLSALWLSGALPAWPASPHVPLPQPRPTEFAAAGASIPAALPRPGALNAPAIKEPIASAETEAVKNAIELIRHGKINEATDLEKSAHDPAAKKLIEWMILRNDDNNAGFDRYMAFINANPSWPNLGMMRRRAEAMLWQERRDPQMVKSFFAAGKPLTTKGHFALARALLAQGDRTGAQYYVRETWRNDTFSRDLEAQGLEIFRDLLTKADLKARMDHYLQAEDIEPALRIAQELGPTDMAIARARIAVITKAANAGALLDAVPAEARRDPGYLFSRIQWLRRNEQIAEAGRLMLTAPHDADLLSDVDQWWVERRLVARKLLDIGDAQTAYLVARDAATPARENYRGEHEFTAGWIALRFLSNSALAQMHFSRISRGVANPITLARAAYWQGRAAEAAGRQQEAHAHYETAARYPTAYYGQIARAKLGLGEIVLRPPPGPPAAQRSAVMNLDIVRAVRILYAINEREFVIPFVADLAEHGTDIGALVLIAEITTQHEDARATLLLGKAALGRGFAFDNYAFPIIGIPNYAAVGPGIDKPVAYAIVRQESEFNQKDLSSANAMGLMQVTPEAGRYVAKKFHVSYDRKRLALDSVYNTQMGAAELGDLLQDYRGSYILTFAGYNAGRGRVHEWVARYGDPRDPNVDPIDWVERIPFSETRNYVQRVMENLQVYRVRHGLGSKLLIEADLHRGAL